MNFDLFLFDADDTLFDFKASEEASFKKTLEKFDITFTPEIFATYKIESGKLWRQLELGQTTKDFLKIERFKKTLEHFKINRVPEELSEAYLDFLPETVYLNENAVEICDYLNKLGTVGIVTNGMENVQKRRLEISKIKDNISFMVVSEECGFAKPDKRFFEHTMVKANRTSKEGILVIGDRIETDILGAHNFGLKSCWYNPHKLTTDSKLMDYEISNLTELKDIVSK